MLEYVQTKVSNAYDVGSAVHPSLMLILPNGAANMQLAFFLLTIF